MEYQFKEGDIVVSLPGFNPTDNKEKEIPPGGYGWKEEEINKLKSIDKPYATGLYNCWTCGPIKGIKNIALRLADPDEIEAYNKGITSIKNIEPKQYLIY